MILIFQLLEIIKISKEIAELIYDRSLLIV